MSNTPQITIKQLLAVQRLSRQGWLLEEDKIILQRDGMLEGWMTAYDAKKAENGEKMLTMYFGISPEGGIHT
jgi:hypothetical protein